MEISTMWVLLTKYQTNIVQTRIKVWNEVVEDISDRKKSSKFIDFFQKILVNKSRAS